MQPAIVRVTVASLLLAAPLGAQARWTAVADSSPFRPLDLPAPSAVRTASGRPGAGYWQQRADYRIRATLDPATHRITGEEVITYHNRSPDALPHLWLHVEQNICAPESITNRLNQPPLVFLGSAFDFSCQGFAGGGTMTALAVDGRAARATRYGTTLRVDLPEPLAPGASTDLAIAWHFTVPPSGAARMGRDGDLHEVAQWYPRMVVYDDVRGWNHEPYIGAGEFYLEYGSFEVELTVPAAWTVAATGQLMNPEAVLTTETRARLARARNSEEPVAIVTAAEALVPARHRPAIAGTLTWHFRADSVRDFAFAAGPGLRWDASGYDGILIQTLYRPAATKWEEANRMARGAIRHFSERWMRYPYSHATSVEGPIEGMEYPMLTFVPDSPTREDLHWVLAHELGHQWFPMVVGSNERLYPWMDEGFNTFIDLANVAEYFAGTAYGDTIGVHPLHLHPDHAVPGAEQPLITRPVEVRDLFWGAYQKPALMLSLLRDEVLGPDRFDDAFRDYMRTWAYRHPTPADFFRLMRDRSGMDLDWFWRGWVFTTARLDQAIAGIRSADGGSVVELENRGTMVMPARLEVRYADGTAERVELPVEMWNLGDRFTWHGPPGRRVTSATLDPAAALPDVDRDNNHWPRR
ncbi:MAG: M1 family metallopeptidase [Gemmatimonadetes bacterium]|nr:M1 family metallopeptidase [Gemmatimonadota bacterium]MCB9505353.1 M1 family metallopeptidase [Gemmatimonadales bacterium]MCA9767879.1 M1 family metallopeptidase [Gemmatimonadota bacterium]MCB9518762.1 M1 family metallopeptidase [Gemmatimonadales bacterium]HPF61550.1 M1 family metallopeptidase [Gemmatimonadales bacterium]